MPLYIIYLILWVIPIAFSCACFVSPRVNRVVMTLVSGLIRGYSPSTCIYSLNLFRLETNGFTSNIFNRCNNVSGMHVPGNRDKKGIIDSFVVGVEKFAVYNSVWNSIADYYLRQKYFKMPSSFANLQAFVEWNKSTNYFGADANTYFKRADYFYSDNVTTDWLIVFAFFLSILATFGVIGFTVFFYMRYKSLDIWSLLKRR